MSMRFRHYQAVLGLALLGACASTATQYPEFSAAEIAAGTVDVQRGTIEAHLERSARIDDIAWPLLVANADLCWQRRREAFGVTFGNARSIVAAVDGLTDAHVRAVGYDDAPIVLSVAAGSPADRAGIRAGARPVHIDGKAIDGDMDRLGKAISAYHEARSDAPAEMLRVTFEQAGKTLETMMQPETICNISITSRETSAINASASADSVRINRGMLQYFEDDNDVAVIIGHEIAHVIGRHVPKQRRNAMVSLYSVWGIPVQFGASLFDAMFAGPLERFAGVETPPGQAGITRINNGVLRTRDFEQEADYVGLYIAARGGVDISHAEGVFEGLSKVSARSTYGNRSHPVTPQRVLAMQATREEIEAKRASGASLIPNGWPWPVYSGSEDAPETDETD